MSETERRTFIAGQMLARQGEYGDCAWLIEHGQVEVLLSDPAGVRRLALVGAGSIIGEMALIDNGPRSASLRAVDRVTCLELSYPVFQRLLGQAEPLAVYLLESLIATIRRSYGRPPPERLGDGADIRSSRDFRTVTNRRMFPKGHTFFRTGDAGDHAYLIQSGAVNIWSPTTPTNGDRIRLGPGRIFGEMALLSPAPRRATATAAESSVCEVIRQERFTQAVASLPPILRALIKIYVRHLERLIDGR